MKIFYNLVVRLCYLFLRLATIFNRKAKLWIEGRHHWEEKLMACRKDGRDWIWFHCSSVGEFEDVFVVFHEIKKKFSNKKILLTFFSSSGYEQYKDSDFCDLILYMPLDTKSNARRFIEIFRPEMVFFSRSELWYYFLTELKKQRLPTYLVSLLLNDSHSYFKWFMKKHFKECFTCFTHIFCQNKKTQDLLVRHFSYSATSVCGNSRIDRIYNHKLSKVFLPEIERVVGNRFGIVVGSSLEKDEDMVLKAIEELKHLPIVWMIAPHEINPKQIDKIISGNPDYFIKYSDIKNIKPGHQVIYIDFVGGLKNFYRYASLAIIGGGFDKIGIHNIIEPAVYGVKTLFGPNHKNYPEALDLLELGGAQIFHDQKNLIDIIKTELKESLNTERKNKIIDYVKSNTGAAEKIISLITENKI